MNGKTRMKFLCFDSPRAIRYDTDGARLQINVKG